MDAKTLTQRLASSGVTYSPISKTASSKAAKDFTDSQWTALDKLLKSVEQPGTDAAAVAICAVVRRDVRRG